MVPDSPERERPPEVTSHATRVGAVAAALFGFSVLGVANALVSLARHGIRSGAVVQRLGHLGFLLLHHAILAVLLGVLAGAYVRLVPARLSRRGEALAACASAFAASFAVSLIAFEEDLGGLSRLVALGVTCVLALGVPVVIGTARLVGRRWFGRVALVAIAAGTVAVNHAALKLNYPGFHVWLVVVGGVALAFASHGLPLRRTARALSSRPVVALFSLSAAAGLVLPPSARVRVALANDEVASLYLFISAARVELMPSRRVTIVADEREPVPAGRPVVPRDDLVVVMITIDALRWDVYRDHPELTPSLHDLAAEGADFQSAYAPSTETKGTIASIFSGRSVTALCWKYVEFGSSRSAFPHDDPTPRLPELLTAAGFDTFTVPSTERLVPDFGVARGFARSVELPLGPVQQLAHALVPHWLAWLDAPTSKRRFGYLHLMDAHEPYDSVRKTGPAVLRYRSEVGAADRALGVFIAATKARGLWDRTVVIVTADHGEAFGEHNQTSHGGSVYEELAHVPLVIRVPGLAHRTIDDVVSGLDLAPTVLDVAGLETPAAYLGRSLVPLLVGDALPPRPAPIESMRGHRALVFPDATKVITDDDTGSIELYDLADDPGELENVVDERPDAGWRFEALDTYFQSNEAHGFGCRTKRLH